MTADGTDLGRLRRFTDIAAVAALPDDLLVLLKHLLILDISEFFLFVCPLSGFYPHAQVCDF